MFEFNSLFIQDCEAHRERAPDTQETGGRLERGRTRQKTALLTFGATVFGGLATLDSS